MMGAELLIEYKEKGMDKNIKSFLENLSKKLKIFNKSKNEPSKLIG